MNDINDLKQELVGEFEVHGVEKIREYFSKGIDPNDFYQGRRLVDVMITMYSRTQRFSECIKAFIDFGLKIDDKFLFIILMNNASNLRKMLENNPLLVNKRYTIERNAYIPLISISPLHICAEYNHVDCAKTLLDFGADVNDRGGTTEQGFGGQTPIFHTVNQNQNNSFEMLNFLLENGADLEITVQGIEWGRGYDWETLIPSVNPISYAIMGLLPQMHRRQEDISEVVSLLLKKKYGIEYHHRNVPNKYLKSF